MKITITDLQNINLTYSETIALALLVKHLNWSKLRSVTMKLIR